MASSTPDSSSGHYIVAIDGTSGSGKSSTARAVARELGLLPLDTGAMYRAVTWLALQNRIDPGRSQAVAALAKGLDLDVDPKGTLLVDGRDLSLEIRGPE